MKNTLIAQKIAKSILNNS